MARRPKNGPKRPRQSTQKRLTMAEVQTIQAAFQRGMGIWKARETFHISPDTAKHIRDGTHYLLRDEVKIERCPDCGHKVKLPCQICEARLYREIKQSRPELLSAYF